MSEQIGLIWQSINTGKGLELPEHGLAANMWMIFWFEYGFNSHWEPILQDFFAS